jgi:tetratricopeptide (TPR) repeat protein
LSELLYERAKKTEDDALMTESLEQAALALKITSNSSPAFVSQGLAYYALGQPRRALQSFQAALDCDRDNLVAERNLQRLKSQIRYEKRVGRRADRYGNLIAVGASLAIIALWLGYMVGDESKFSSTTVISLTTVLSALVIIGAVLPRLAGFKLPGVEAQLQASTSDFGAGPSAAGPPSLTASPRQELSYRPPSTDVAFR